MHTKQTQSVQVERRALVAALETLAPLADRSGRTTLANVLVEREDVGSLRLTATDYATTLRVTVASPGDLPAAFLLPATAGKALKGWKADTVTITLEGHDVRLEAGGAGVSFQVPEVGLYPLTESPEPDYRMSVDTPTLHATLERTVAYALDNEARANLKAVHVRLDKGKAHFTATDGHRLARRLVVPPIAPEGKATEALLPASAVRHWLRASKKERGEANVHWDDATFRFTVNGVECFGRLVEGTFPTVEPIIIPMGRNPVSFEAVALADAIKAVTATCTDKQKPIALRVGGNRIVVASEPDDDGHQSVQIVPATCHGAEFSIGFNGKYLLDMLKPFTRGRAALTAPDPEKATRWMLADDPAFLAIVMPLKVGFAAPAVDLPPEESTPRPKAPAKRRVQPPRAAPPPAPKAAPAPVAAPPADPTPAPPPPAAPATAVPFGTSPVPMGKTPVPIGKRGAHRLAELEAIRAKVGPVVRDIPAPIRRVAPPASPPMAAVPVAVKPPPEPVAVQAPAPGAKARKQPLTPERRSEIARKAAETRRANLARKAS